MAGQSTSGASFLVYRLSPIEKSTRAYLEANLGRVDFGPGAEAEGGSARG